MACHVRCGVNGQRNLTACCNRRWDKLEDAAPTAKSLGMPGRVTKLGEHEIGINDWILESGNQSFV